MFMRINILTAVYKQVKEDISKQKTTSPCYFPVKYLISLPRFNFGREAPNHVHFPFLYVARDC